MLSTHLKQRLATGLFGVFILFLSIYFSYSPLFGPVFLLLNIVVICGALREYYRLAKHKGFSPLSGIGILCSVFYLLSIYMNQLNPSRYALPAFILFLTLMLLFFSYFDKQSDPLVNLAVTLFGLGYLTIPLSFGLKINYFDFGHL